jgi:hypothetical protein
MQENQELINSLLEKQKTSAYSQQVAMDPEENQLLITRVVSAKYKVYVIILLILGVLIGTTYLPDAQRHYESVNARYEAKQAELTTLQQQVNESFEKIISKKEEYGIKDDTVEMLSDEAIDKLNKRIEEINSRA